MAYDAVAAIRDLQEENLLEAVLLPGPQGARIVPAAELEGRDVAGSFQGAGLDSRRLDPGNLFVALAGQKVDGRRFVPAVLAAGHWTLTRHIPQDDPLNGAPLASGSGALLCCEPEKALACLARRWRRRLEISLLGITGTNGKTTTKDLARALLGGAGPTQATQGNFNNQLGLPITLLNLRPETRYAVIEMGASAVGEIRFLAGVAEPDVGLITNASAAHLEEFGSLENIIAGKGELLEALPPDGRAILNADSPGYEQWRARSVCPVVSWGRQTGDHRWSHAAAAGDLILDGETWPVTLPGAHNAANLCAAILAGRALGVTDAQLRDGLAHFTPSEHRSRLFTWNGRTILDDSYNANPGSLQAAAQALLDLPAAGRKLAVLGRMAELGPDSAGLHRESGAALARLGLDGLLAVGEGARELATGFGTDAGGEALGSQEQAFLWLEQNTAEGDAILVKGSRSAGMDRVVRLMEEGMEA